MYTIAGGKTALRGGLLSRLRSSGVGRVMLDIAVILAAAIGVAQLSGSEKWTPPFSPDSEFYFTLGVFGDDVTDRAPNPSYFWTKLGVIAPMRVLFDLFGVGPGWTLYRLLLILLIVGAVYYFAKWAGARRLVSLICSLVVGLNSAVLFSVGNTYFPGTAMAAMFVCLALAARFWLTPTATPWPIGIGIGLSAAWLLMTNPYSFGLAIATSGIIVLAGTRRRDGWLRAGVVLGTGVLGLLAGLSLFLIAAQVLFPKLNWVDTVLKTSVGIDYSIFTSADPFTWIPTATSLLVPAAAILLSVVGVLKQRGAALARLSLVMTATSFVVAVVWALWQGGATMEAQYYNALLWPAALMGLVAFVVQLFAAPVVSTRIGAVAVAAGAFLVLVPVAHLDVELRVRVIVLVFVAVLALVVLAVFRLPVGSGRSRWTRSVAPLAITGLLFVAFQTAQNSQPQSNGISWRIDYATAFEDSVDDVTLERSIEIEAWLISETTPDDKVFVWVDPDVGFISAAALQLFGPNTLTTSFELAPVHLVGLDQSRPDVLATYTFNPDAEQKIADELTSEGYPTTVFACETFEEYSQDRAEVKVCLSRIEYPAQAGE